VIVWFDGQVVMVGCILSLTVMVAVQVEVFPEPSVAVSVTVLPPELLQLNVVGVTETEGVPQLSVELLFTWEAVMEAVPAPERFTDMF